MNYYRISTLSQEEKDKLIKAIQEDRIDSFTYTDEEGKEVSSEDTPLKIHIGKSSRGWKFLFDHNNWKYYQNLKSFKEWLKEGKIINEDGDPLTVEELFDWAEKKKEGQSHKDVLSNYPAFEVKDKIEWDTDFC